MTETVCVVSVIDTCCACLKPTRRIARYLLTSHRRYNCSRMLFWFVWCVASFLYLYRVYSCKYNADMYTAIPSVRPSLSGIIFFTACWLHHKSLRFSRTKRRYKIPTGSSNHQMCMAEKFFSLARVHAC